MTDLSRQRTLEVEIDGGGWWPPGEGEPGTDWGYEVARLKLQLGDGESQVDGLMPTPNGDRALASIPVDGIAALFAQGYSRSVGDE
jgi:hypothetical protein